MDVLDNRFLDEDETYKTLLDFTYSFLKRGFRPHLGIMVPTWMISDMADLGLIIEAKLIEELNAKYNVEWDVLAVTYQKEENGANEFPKLPHIAFKLMHTGTCEHFEEHPMFVTFNGKYLLSAKEAGEILEAFRKKKTVGVGMTYALEH